MQATIRTLKAITEWLCGQLWYRMIETAIFVLGCWKMLELSWWNVR